MTLAGSHQSSLFHIEMNPWAQDVHLEHALLLRGTFLSATGYMETLLTEWAVRSSRLPEYQEIRDRFPRHRKDRIDYISAIAATEGALSPLATDILSIADAFVKSWDFRDLLAHGSMSVISARGVKGGASATFKDFAPKGADVQCRDETISLGDFEELSAAAAAESRKAHLLGFAVGKLLPPL